MKKIENHWFRSKQNLGCLFFFKFHINSFIPQLATDSTLLVNDSFSNKRPRFKVTMVTTSREQATEAQQTHVAVEEDRKMYLQVSWGHLDVSTQDTYVLHAVMCVLRDSLPKHQWGLRGLTVLMPGSLNIQPFSRLLASKAMFPL